MQIEFQNTKRDYIQLYNFLAKEAIQKYLAAIVIITLFMAISAGGKPFSWSNFASGLLFFPAFLGMLYIIAYFRWTYLLYRSTLKDENYREKKKADITDEGLLITYNSGSTKIYQWQKIVSVYSNDNALYLKLSDKRTFLINKRCFSSADESKQFSEEIESHILKNGGWLKNQFLPVPKPPYWMGSLCLIPLIGAVIGIILIVNGISKYKNKWLVLMGAGGVIFTIIFYTSLNLFFLSSFERKQMIPFAQSQLNTLMKEVEFYKIQHGVYPDSLKQATTDDAFTSTIDPIQPEGKKDTHYNYKKVGSKYYLFSSGVDGIPNTADDIYPKMSPADTSKFGLIIK